MSFDKYKELKLDFDYDYKGYPIGKILSVDLASLAFDKNKFSIRVLLNLFLKRKIKIPESSELLFSIGDYRRKDYYEILSYIRNSIREKSDLIDLSKNENNKVVCISINNIFLSFKIISQSSHLQSLCLLDKMTLASKLVYTLNSIDSLEQNQTEHRVSRFISFCSNLNEEAILDFYYQKKGVETLTLQHGLWFIYSSPPIDAITYENLVANKLLCWGKYTKDEFLRYGIESERIIVSGYPKNHKQLVARTIKGRVKILVLLSRAMFDKNNFELLDLLLTCDVEADFFIKIHPSLSFEKYARYASLNGFKMAEDQTIPNLLGSNKYDFSVSYNSTAYYDSYINNCVSLRYKDSNFDNSIDVMDDGFITAEDFMSKLENFRIAVSEESFWLGVSKRLNYILGLGVNDYGDIFTGK